MSLFLIVPILLTSRSISSYSGWVTPSHPLLPRPDISTAICYFNDSILLFGGWFAVRQFVQYNISNNSMTDYGTEALPMNAYGSGHYYTQINHLFYWIQPNTSNIIEYNIPMNTFKSEIIMDVFVSFGCLASYNNLLFVVGGLQITDPINTLQIFNLSNQMWLNPANIASMNTGRSQHACIVDETHQKLYAIGGMHYDTVLVSVETILLHDVKNETWIFSQDLIYPTESTHAIIISNNILLIGGRDDTVNNVNILQNIQVIDTSTGSVSIDGQLDYGVAETASIVVDDVIYAFGGIKLSDNNTQIGVNTWQYLRISQSGAASSNSLRIAMIIGGIIVLIFAIVSMYCVGKSGTKYRKSGKSNLKQELANELTAITSK